jgi:molybdopterin-guanine dinucleotide biosynthesis protein A
MGTSKGLLLAPDGSGRTLVERLVSELALSLKEAPVVLVGKREEYAHLGIPFVEDEIPESGPLGGLVALLAQAEALGAPRVLCIACDHPRVSAPLLRRISLEHPENAICAPFLDDRYQPLVGRYDTRLLSEFRRALKEGRRALQPLLREHAAARLELSEAEKESLRDWDTPLDLIKDGS